MEKRDTWTDSQTYRHTHEMTDMRSRLQQQAVNIIFGDYITSMKVLSQLFMFAYISTYFTHKGVQGVFHQFFYNMVQSSTIVKQQYCAVYYHP